METKIYTILRTKENNKTTPKKIINARKQDGGFLGL
jgi:hypothetical protein